MKPFCHLSSLGGMRGRPLAPGTVVAAVLLMALRLFGDVPPLFLTGGSSGFTSTPDPSSTVGIGWDPSPSVNVTGYFLYWGFASGQCTNQLDVGNATATTVGGLVTNTVYYFTAAAYDNWGLQSPMANEIQYQVSPASAAGTGPTFTLQLQPNGTTAPTVQLGFQGSAGAVYTVQATEDLHQWVTVCTTNCLADGPMAFGALDTGTFAKRFYRLLKQ